MGAQRDEIRAFVDAYVDEHFEELWAVAEDIHAHPEVAFEEHRTAEVCKGVLRSHGFGVEDGWEWLPTGFRAQFRQGEGRMVGVCSELDALPVLGHACGHNLIATSGMLSGMAAKAAMERFGIEGGVAVLGTPAEESGGGKIVMLDHGAFDGIDAAFLMHPTSACTRIGGECTSFVGCYITFTGVPAQAESHPDRGVNAMDAASLFHQALGVRRQQLPDDVHICDVILEISNDVGQIPAHAKIEAEVSSLNGAHVGPAIEALRQIAEGVALATGCSWEWEDIPGYLGRVPNATLGDVLRAELSALGEPVMEGMPSDQGGEDFGDVSRRIPGVNLFGTLLPERKISGHTVEFRELAVSDAARHCLRVTSKAMAATFIEVLTDEALVERATVELQERLRAEA